MTWPPQFVYAFLVALFCAGIGVKAARVWNNEALRPAGVSAIRDSKAADPDYMQGLARLGIVKLPGYEPRPAVLTDARPTK
jgi:hypothetical protein